MSKVFFDVAVSIDGFLAGPNARPDNPLGDGGTRIHEWMFKLASWRERAGLEGGVRTPDDTMVAASFERAGAYLMGRRMFDEGEANWPANAPFRAPVFVLTHERREPWVREGGTTFYFVTDGCDAALEQASAAANGKDVKLAGGAKLIQQFIKMGAVDDLTIHLAPLMLGGGVRLFESIDPERLALEATGATHSPFVTHLSYRVVK